MRRPRESFIVTLTDAAPNDPDAGPLPARLKRALKCLLRSFGLRCTRIANAPPSTPDAPGDPREADGPPDAPDATPGASATLTRPAPLR